MNEEDIIAMAKIALPKGVRSCYNKKHMIDMFRAGVTYAMSFMAHVVRSVESKESKVEEQENGNADNS